MRLMGQLICLNARRTITCLMLFFVAMVLSAAPSSGALFRVAGNTKFVADSGFLGVYDTSTPSPFGIRREVVSDFTVAMSPNYHLESTAEAGIGGLHSHTFGQIVNDEINPFGGTWQVSANSLASGRYDDVVVSGPAGPVTTSVNVSLDGGLSVGASPAVFSNYAQARAEVRFYVNGGYIGGGIETRGSQLGSGAVVISKNGILSVWDGAGTIASPSFTVPANVPFVLEVQLLTSVFASGYAGVAFNSSAISSFDDTLKFASGGPVFNVADGYAVNSADAGIINNAFGVPEPGTLALVCWAPLVIGIYWRRTSRQPSNSRIRTHVRATSRFNSN